MLRKIIVLALSFSVLFACQQASTAPENKVSSPEKMSSVGNSNTMKENIADKSVHQQTSFTATIRYMNLEGGFYGLIATDGKHWLPMNLTKEFRQNGAIVKVQGHEIKGMMTIQQWGTPFSITSIEVIKAGSKGGGNREHLL